MLRQSACLLSLLAIVGCAEFQDRPRATAFSSKPHDIEIASNDVIRIVTPFSEPRVVTTSDAEITRSKHVLYVLPSDQKPLSMFVTDARDEAFSLNLTLRPRDGGTREIDAVALGSAQILPAGSKAAAQVAAKQPTQDEAWPETKCRLCRLDGQSGSDSDSYGGGNDGKSW